MGKKGTKASNIFQVLKGAGAWTSKDSKGPEIKKVGWKVTSPLKKSVMPENNDISASEVKDKTDNLHKDDAKNKDAKKPWVKKGGKATGKMKDYALQSDERKAEYDARGWKYDDTIKGYDKEGNKIKDDKKDDDKKDDDVNVNTNTNTNTDTDTDTDTDTNTDTQTENEKKLDDAKKNLSDAKDLRKQKRKDNRAKRKEKRKGRRADRKNKRADKIVAKHGEGDAKAAAETRLIGRKIGEADKKVAKIAKNEDTSYKAKKRKTQRKIKKVDKATDTKSTRKDRMERAEVMLEREGVKKPSPANLNAESRQAKKAMRRAERKAKKGVRNATKKGTAKSPAKIAPLIAAAAPALIKGAAGAIGSKLAK